MEKNPKQPIPNEPPAREIIAEWVSRYNPKYSLDWILKQIVLKIYKPRIKEYLLYCPKCESISQETFNEIEARGFGISWKTKKSAQFDGYYLITWGAN